MESQGREMVLRWRVPHVAMSILTLEQLTHARHAVRRLQKLSSQQPEKQVAQVVDTRAKKALARFVSAAAT